MVAGAAIKQLAIDYAGQPVVFLEYYANASVGNRESRFVAAFGGWGFSVPEAIVGSGYRYSQGPADYYNVFRSMIEAEKGRPPQVELAAWWWRAGPNTMRVYATLRNTSGLVLDPAANEACIWGLAWERKAALGVTGMYTRDAVLGPLLAPVPPGGMGSVTVDLFINSLVDWNQLHPVALAEVRPGGTTGRYDALQAVVAQPAAFTVSQPQVQLAIPQGPSAAELSLAGPHVLTWTASTSAAWLTVTPTSGTTGGIARIEADLDYYPYPEPHQAKGTVTFAATSPDGMSFVATVEVTADYDPNWTRSRQLPRRKLPRAAGVEPPQ
ncbi:MAG TPA: hypothetical protein P5234_09320 [Thermoanaerobaculaceae bacterium]|nr:hypothetical protein [Thermoanaerobaculaceae bacterium]HRS16431.1 hypothetical protein [Thermoanaerobaculaceae bacterium]